MSAAHLPLVSCVMPTYNRRAFVPQAISYFLRQDYPNKELIVIDDGQESVEDLVPQTDQIRYVRLPQKITLGAKLNMACEYARGPIIANWDDDDWYAPWRLSYQMETMRDPDIVLCGINQLLYFDLNTHNGFLYVYPPEQRIWLLGSSQCYRKDWWQKIRFDDINVGMDGLFTWATPPEKVRALEKHHFAVHFIHTSNVSPKQTSGAWWHPFPQEEIVKTVGTDWVFYKNGCKPVQKEQEMLNSIHNDFQKKPHRNVFACLVHEKPECVLDLVRNLHDMDPHSTIVLYNGGTDAQLFKNEGALKAYGATIHPQPSPQPYGYLHGFALDCMEWALRNGHFDTLTIVDSDQMCIRAGYSEFLGDFLKKHPTAGLLSSMPERVLPHYTQYHIPLQAYREYDLWKPLLDSYPNGPESFVHWTFWPSTVFTYAAVRDLVALYRTNEQVRYIFKQSKIWASEEVFFPTLVRLLGYDIVQNPCTHQFVQYKQVFSLASVEQAFRTENAFWMHPVVRDVSDTVRQKINLHAARNGAKRLQQNTSSCSEITGFLPDIQHIEGWLSAAEATLLGHTVLTALQQLPAPHHLVEIGAYHGKATVLIGKLLKKYFPKARLSAVDPHDGLLGDRKQGLQQFPPSLSHFTKNIADAGVKSLIKPVTGIATSIYWKQTLCFLLVDGLHDYESVSSDFRHFEPWLVPGAYIAFHDYAAYFPGVQAFVNELLVRGGYHIIQLAESMMVIRKNNT